MKKFLLIIFFTTIIFAQNANRKFINFKPNKTGININVSDGKYIIKSYSNNIVETTFLPSNETYNSGSHAVELAPNVNIFKVKESKNTVSLASNSIIVTIQKSPFQISYFNKDNLLFSEKDGYKKQDSTHTINFNLDKTEVLYGGGARALGMNRRGNRLPLYNRAQYGYETRVEQMNFCIPLVLSSKKYAIHFDNPAIGYLDLDSKKDNTLTYETISGRKTYQVIVGETWEDLIDNYTMLTGKQPLPARWTLGNFSSRFGYHTQEEVEKTIRKFQEEKIPVDAIILDLYWFGKSIKGTMGNLDWDKDNFPNPTKMIADLNAKNVKTVLITEPFVLSTSSKWQDAVDKKVLAVDKSGNPARWDFYFGNTGIVDIWKPEGKTWFWNIYKGLINQGVGGLWGDLGEPEVFPSKVFTAGGKADEVHNIYGHNWAKLIQDGYKKDFAAVRPFILMRAGYSGSQRFGMIPWSGDVSRSWGGLQSQTEIALQMGMQGLGYMHSDLGGFAGDYFDNELYLRWLQYGVFNPIFRPHAQEDVSSEAIYKDIVTKAQAKKLIELRYQMLPYNYTLAFENNQKGIPLMRPVLFEEPENVALSTVSDTYLWGNNFLVAPITSASQTSKTIYFPKNNNWFGFYTDEKFLAGTTTAINVTADNIPTFVRGGSFIPMIKTIQNTAEYSLSNFDLHFYFDEYTKISTGKLYNDDGITPNAFEIGKYELLTFGSNFTDKNLTLNLTTEIGKLFSGSDKNVTLMLHNSKNKVKSVSINGKNTIFIADNNLINIEIDWKSHQNQIIKIQF